MKVLVVGSEPSSASDVERAAFQKCAEDVGGMLAREKHEVLLASSDPVTADHWVLQGMSRVAGVGVLTVFQMKNEPSVTVPRKPEGSGTFRIRFRRAPDIWQKAIGIQVQEADAVVIIGGGKGSLQLAYVAAAMERPVIALGALGGAGREIGTEFEPYFSSRGELDANYLAIQQAWDDHSPAKVSDLLRRWVKNNSFKKRKYDTGVGLFVVASALISVWVLAYVTPNSQDYQQLLFFLLLVLASFLGTILKTAIQSVSNLDQPGQRPSIWVELLMGMLISLTLFLGCVVGSLGFTGTALTFPDTVESIGTNGFQRLGAIFSFIGIVGGWRSQQMAARIAAALDQQFGRSGAS